MTDRELLDIINQEIEAIDLNNQVVMAGELNYDKEELDSYLKMFNTSRNSLTNFYVYVTDKYNDKPRLDNILNNRKSYLNWLNSESERYDFLENHTNMDSKRIASQRAFLNDQKKRIQKIILEVEKRISSIQS
jgi:hypothetical protein